MRLLAYVRNVRHIVGSPQLNEKISVVELEETTNENAEEMCRVWWEWIRDRGLWSEGERCLYFPDQVIKIEAVSDSLYEQIRGWMN